MLIIYNHSFGQTMDKENCKIEFYLLKFIKPNLDTTNKLSAPFSVNKTDIEDKAFIKDNEIFGYFFLKDTVKFKDSSIIRTRQKFVVSTLVTTRINNLNIPLCCGKQFALVVNDVVVYTGYFWNFFSSFACDGITAFADNGRIYILKDLPEKDYAKKFQDQRQNSNLFDCLLKTNRLHSDKEIQKPINGTRAKEF